MKFKSIITKQNLLISLLVIFCLFEAVKMLNYSQPILLSFQDDPASGFRHGLREGIFCAKAELQSLGSHQFYFLDDPAFAPGDMLFETFYTSYILLPEIYTNYDPNFEYAVTIINPIDTKKLLAENKYELLKQCANGSLLVLKRK